MKRSLLLVGLATAALSGLLATPASAGHRSDFGISFYFDTGGSRIGIGYSQNGYHDRYYDRGRYYGGGGYYGRSAYYDRGYYDRGYCGPRYGDYYEHRVYRRSYRDYCDW